MCGVRCVFCCLCGVLYDACVLYVRCVCDGGSLSMVTVLCVYVVYVWFVCGVCVLAWCMCECVVYV